MKITPENYFLFLINWNKYCFYISGYIFYACLKKHCWTDTNYLLNAHFTQFVVRTLQSELSRIKNSYE